VASNGQGLTLRELHFGFPSRADFLGPVTLNVAPGDCWSIVGPNGAGKTTLLRLMAGLTRPSSGTILLGEHALYALPSRERARRVAMVPQSVTNDLDLTARELVLLGRYPHRTFGLFESAADERLAERAMAVTETLDFADRRMDTLSGGEAQRVHIAAALAQEPAVLLLDEPTSSLDLRHQLGIHALLRRRAAADALAVVVVTHDVNLALRFSTHVLLLSDGKVAAVGAPEDVLRPEKLTEVYGVEMVTLGGAGGDVSWLVPHAPEGEACES